MKLHSPQFEKSLRKEIRRTLRESPRLRQQTRSVSKTKKLYSGYSFVRVLGLIIFSSFAGGAAAGTGHIPPALAVITLMTFASVFVHAEGLWKRLYASPDLAALHALPLTTDVIFRWELQKHLRPAIWSFIDLCAMFGTLAFMRHFHFLGWLLTLLVALLAWAATLSLAALCVVRVRRQKYAPIILATYSLFVFSFLAGGKFGWDTVLVHLDEAAPSINVLLPTGWAVSLFQLLLPSRPWLLLLLLFPVAAVISTWRSSLNRCQRSYVIRENIRHEFGDIIPAGEIADAPLRIEAAPSNQAQPFRLGLTAIIEIIESRQFLAAPAWHRKGWFERTLWEWLSPREKAISECVFPKGLSISSEWLAIFKTLGIATGIAFLVGTASPLAKIWVLIAGLFITFCMVLGRICWSGTAFQLVPCNGIYTPVYAHYALGLRELAQLIIKATTVQAPAIFAWSTLAGLIIAHLCRISMLAGFLHGMRGGCLMCAGRFIVSVFSFSSGTSPSRNHAIRTLIYNLSMCLFFGLFLGLAGVGLCLPKNSTGWLLTGLAALDAFIFFQVYAWFYEMSFFNLIKAAKR